MNHRTLYFMGEPRISPSTTPTVNDTARFYQVIAYCYKCQLNDEILTVEALQERVYADISPTERERNRDENEDSIHQYIRKWNRALGSPSVDLTRLQAALVQAKADIGVFHNTAIPLRDWAESDGEPTNVARNFMEKAVPLMNGGFLPASWTHEWVQEWRSEVENLYATALEKAAIALKTLSLEERYTLFGGARNYKSVAGGVLPAAQSIWKGLEQEKRMQSAGVSGQRLPLEERRYNKREERTKRNDARPAQTTGLKEADIVLLGTTALLEGEAWLEIERVALDLWKALLPRPSHQHGGELAGIQNSMLAFTYSDLNALGIQKEYQQEREIAFLSNSGTRTESLKKFWETFKDRREVVWKWIIRYGGSADPKIKEAFAHCLKEFLLVCPDGVETTLHAWLEDPHFLATPENDHKNALYALETAYRSNEPPALENGGANRAKDNILAILEQWKDTRKPALLQASALLAGTCLATSHRAEGLEILKTILIKGKNLENYVGLALRSYLSADASETQALLETLQVWQIDPALKTLTLQVFLMLMNDSKTNAAAPGNDEPARNENQREEERNPAVYAALDTEEPPLLLELANKDNSVGESCKDLFIKAMQNEACRGEGFFQFTFWLERAAKRPEYRIVVKDLATANDNVKQYLARRIENYKGEYEEMYALVVQP